jgi:hypothetical protein
VINTPSQLLTGRPLIGNSGNGGNAGFPGFSFPPGAGSSRGLLFGEDGQPGRAQS